MIANMMQMRAASFEMNTSVWTLAAIGALFESGLVDHLREPRGIDDLSARCPAFTKSRLERTLAVAATSGFVVADAGAWRIAEGALPFLQQPMRAALQGEIRSSLMQPLAFLDSASAKEPTTGWTHTNAALLQAQGDASAAFPPMLKTQIVPTMGDLAGRLEKPGARFLDIGVGVGSLAIAMCRAWPELRVVGVDASDVPLAIARENVARAGLVERIELRKTACEELRDEASFDLVWIPTVFLDAAIVPKALACVRAMLRPGGWMMLPIIGASGDARARSVWALMNDLWGGPVLGMAEAESLVKEAGFTTVRPLPGPAPWAPSMLVAQR